MSRNHLRLVRQAAAAEKARNEAAKRQAELNAETEARLRAALNGVAYELDETKREQERARPSAHKPHCITVVMSCRPKTGGLTVRFEHATLTVSRFEAELEARAAARRAGLNTDTAVILDYID